MLIDRFLQTGRDFLGCDIPIMCGAMTWISEHALVKAIGDAGGFGVLAGGHSPVDDLKKEIIATRKTCDKPFGVNLITVAPMYKEHLDLVCEMKCKTIMLAGAKVICFAPTAPLALKLIDAGADALVLEGSEAGGHIGPVSLTVLLQQILFKVETVPIFVAGGIATGRMMAHLLMMGAAGIQMGTRFVMSQECRAHPRFKEVFRKARARDAVATPQFDSRLPVIPVRALKNEGTIEFSKLQLELLYKLDHAIIDRKDAVQAVERFWAGALREAVIEGEVKKGSLMAGQSVGLVDVVKPIKGIMAEMVDDAEAEMQRLNRILTHPLPGTTVSGPDAIDKRSL